MPFKRMLLLVLAVLLAAQHFGMPTVARAVQVRASGPTPPRLAFVDGEVSFWRPGAEDWAPGTRPGCAAFARAAGVGSHGDE